MYFIVFLILQVFYEKHTCQIILKMFYENLILSRMPFKNYGVYKDNYIFIQCVSLFLVLLVFYAKHTCQFLLKKFPEMIVLSLKKAFCFHFEMLSKSYWAHSKNYMFIQSIPMIFSFAGVLRKTHVSNSPQKVFLKCYF